MALYSENRHGIAPFYMLFIYLIDNSPVNLGGIDIDVGEVLWGEKREARGNIPLVSHSLKKLKKVYRFTQKTLSKHKTCGKLTTAAAIDSKWKILMP